MLNVDNWVKLILDSLYDGVLIADEDHKVIYINPAYTRITGVTYQAIVGIDLEIARPGAKLPEVISTGEPQLGVVRQMGDVEYIVNMVPITESDKIIGGISILNELNDIYKLTEQLKASHQTIKKLQTLMKSNANTRYTFDSIIAVDAASLELKKFAKLIAPKDSNILITGESGTGKELFAQSIHNYSHRVGEPFVALNCASFDKHLIESELFGYEEGAFTGSKKGGKIGLFEMAEGGTLFLDEIAEMEYNLQAKLLRVLQEKTFRRIGGSVEIPTNVRIMAATNRDLQQLITTGDFRMDLFYRIAVMPINILPLRERKNDILPLAHYFLSLNKSKKYILDDAVQKILMNYPWPGNIRELRNAMEFATNVTEEAQIKSEHLPKTIQATAIKERFLSLKPLSAVIKEAELNAINQALLIYGDDLAGKKQASKALGISLASLYNKLKW